MNTVNEMLVKRRKKKALSFHDNHLDSKTKRIEM